MGSDLICGPWPRTWIGSQTWHVKLVHAWTWRAAHNSACRVISHARCSPQTDYTPLIQPVFQKCWAPLSYAARDLGNLLALLTPARGWGRGFHDVNQGSAPLSVSFLPIFPISACWHGILSHVVMHNCCTRFNCTLEKYCRCRWRSNVNVSTVILRWTPHKESVQKFGDHRTESRFSASKCLHACTHRIFRDVGAKRRSSFAVSGSMGSMMKEELLSSASYSSPYCATTFPHIPFHFLVLHSTIRKLIKELP